MAQTEPTERQQYLSFTLGGGDYALPILKVREILQYDGITPVPGTPPSVRGVLNLRGSVVPVIDLALKFGLPATSPTRWTCVLVIETEIDEKPALIGLLADSVREVTELGADDIQQPPAFGTRVRVDYLLGMGRLEKSFVLLLDIDRVLAAGEEELAAALVDARDAAVAPPPTGVPAPPPPGAEAPGA